MAEAYPFQIRSILRAGKSRTLPAGFSMSEPRRGYAYAQAIGTDVPAFWDVTFRFTEGEARIFWLWFTQNLKGGLVEFTMPIRTEFGIVSHTCRFLPDTLLPVSEEGALWSYKATIMARSLVVPDEFVAAGSLIVGLPDWEADGALLDQVVTQILPVA